MSRTTRRHEAYVRKMNRTHPLADVHGYIAGTLRLVIAGFAFAAGFLVAWELHP